MKNYFIITFILFLSLLFLCNSCYKENVNDSYISNKNKCLKNNDNSDCIIDSFTVTLTNNKNLLSTFNKMVYFVNQLNNIYTNSNISRYIDICYIGNDSLISPSLWNYKYLNEPLIIGAHTTRFKYNNTLNNNNDLSNLQINDSDSLYIIISSSNNNNNSIIFITNDYKDNILNKKGIISILNIYNNDSIKIKVKVQK